MEVSPVITSVIGALSSANTKNLFSSITYRGGNEQKITEVVNVLKKVFNDKGLMKGDCLNMEREDDLRKITFFLILNADFNALNNLANSDDLGNIIWSTPTISTCLLMNIIWELKLQDYLYEAIQFSSFDLSFELLSAAAKNIKHLSPENSVMIVAKLISSTYQNNIYSFSDAYKYNNFSSKLNKTLEIVCGLLKYYTDPPNKDKIANKSTYKLYLHVGKAILQFFKIVIKCFQSYIEKPNIPVIPCSEIYLTTFGDEKLPKEDKEKLIIELDEFFKKLNIQILDVLKANVMGINIDIYCSWCEFNDECDSSKTLQRAVGESAYELLNILKSDSRLEHDVVSVLPAISIQPMDINDRIAAADNETLLQNCNTDSPERLKWIHALLYKETFFLEEDFIDCAVQNYKLIDTNDLKYLITKGISALCDDVKYEHRIKIKSMILLMLSSLPFREQLGLFDKKIENKLEMDDFDTKVAEFCNKFVNLEEDCLPYLYGLFVQNPRKVINKVISMAMSSNEQFVLSLQVFETLLKQNENETDIENTANENKSYISELILSEILQIKIDTSTTDGLKDHYVKLISELCKRQFVNNEPIFKLTMDYISEYLSSSNSVLLLLYLKVLDEVYNYETYPNYAAPIIVMIAQIMEAFRWYQRNFENNSVDLISWCSKFIADNIDNFFGTVKNNENKRLWLLENLAFLTPMNAYYFQATLCKDSKIKLLDCSLETKNLEDCLFYLIPRTALSEFNNIYQELKTEKGISQSFNLLCEAIQKVSLEAENLKSSEAFDCLKYCIQSLSILFSNFIVQDIESKHIEYLKRILDFIRLLHPHVQQYAFKSFIPGISSIISKTVKEETVTLEELKELEESIFDSGSKEMFRNLYSKQQ